MRIHPISRDCDHSIDESLELSYMVLLEGLKKGGASEWHSWIYQSAREKKKARFDKLQNELFPVPGGGPLSTISEPFTSLRETVFAPSL